MRDADAVKKALAGCKTLSEGVAKRFCKLALTLNELGEKAKKDGGEVHEETKTKHVPFLKNLWDVLREEELAPDVEWEKVSQEGRMLFD